MCIRDSLVLIKNTEKCVTSSWPAVASINIAILLAFNRCSANTQYRQHKTLLLWFQVMTGWCCKCLDNNWFVADEDFSVPFQKNLRHFFPADRLACHRKINLTERKHVIKAQTGIHCNTKPTLKTSQVWLPHMTECMEEDKTSSYN